MSIRKKVEKYFDDSQGTKMKASRELDYEGMMDEHMKSMFKPTGTKVEMGSRSIKNFDDAPVLKGKAYQDTKKVSRDSLKKTFSSSSSYNSDESEEE
jgi:hypothetical protein